MTLRLAYKKILNKTRGALSVVSPPVEMTPPPKYSLLLTFPFPMTNLQRSSLRKSGDLSFRFGRGRSIKKRLTPHRRLNHPRFSLLRRAKRLFGASGRYAAPDARRRHGENHAQNLLRTRCRRFHPIPGVLYLF